MISRIRRFLHSVRFRLTVWSLAMVALVLVAFSVFIYTRQVQEVQAASMARLEFSTRALLGGYRSNVLVFGEQGDNHEPAVKNVGPIRDDSEIQALFGPDGQVVASLGPSSSNDLVTLVNAWKKTPSEARYYQYRIPVSDTQNGSRSVDYMFLLSPVPLVGGGTSLLVVGQPFDANNQIPRLAASLAAGSLAILLVTLLGGYWLAGRIMRPVKVITRAAREISETDLRRRLNINSPDELGELANTFDAMLARLQAAFDRQRQFTADASHELRTPLAIVKLEAEHALEHKRSIEDYRQSMTVIQSENDTMTTLVNNLLTLARLDSGQNTWKQEPLDLSDLALEVVERLEPLADRKGIALVTGNLPELQITGDRQYLSQMLANLVENGIKYADGGAPWVRVETGLDPTPAESKTPEAWVRVVDNGPGIPPEHLPHLFDRFYRVDASRTRQAGDSGEVPGSGLGLSIAQWIVRAHHGKISVESQVGQGTTFIVRLPAGPVEPA